MPRSKKLINFCLLYRLARLDINDVCDQKEQVHFRSEVYFSPNYLLIGVEFFFCPEKRRLKSADTLIVYLQDLDYDHI